MANKKMNIDGNDYSDIPVWQRYTLTIEEAYKLHCLLSALLLMELSTNEKSGIIKNEYSIPVDDKLRKNVSIMCNLAQGIKDAESAKVIMNMHRKGYTPEQIVEIVGKTIGEVEDVIRKKACIGVTAEYNETDRKAVNMVFNGGNGQATGNRIIE